MVDPVAAQLRAGIDLPRDTEFVPVAFAPGAEHVALCSASSPLARLTIATPAVSRPAGIPRRRFFWPMLALDLAGIIPRG